MIHRTTGWSAGSPPLIQVWSASTRARINPFSCSNAFSRDPSAWGSWTNGSSRTAWDAAEPLAPACASTTLAAGQEAPA
eukprot:14390325-Alexandrium_andersonii.AAC.1